MLLEKYTKSDCKKLRELLVERAKENCCGTDKNYLLLSGGMDSTTALYSLLEAGVKFTAYTFYVDGFESQDLKAVQNLEKQIGFPIVYVPIKSKYEDIEADLKLAILHCKKVFGKIREVKVETILAMIVLSKYLPDGGNVIMGDYGDTVVGYNRTIAKIVYVHGEDSHWTIDTRKGSEDKNEYEEILFNGRNYVEMFQGKPMDFILNFTTVACNKRFPKSIYYYAFYDMHNKYHSYRKPKSFHKACNEKAMFNLMAQSRGYKNALEMFKAIYKEISDER